MPLTVRTGMRYRSQVCSTEMIVVRSPNEPVELGCGGQPVIPIDEAPGSSGAPAPGLDSGTQVGKRYVDPEETIEILVTKAGDGTLTIGGTPLELATPRKLPISD